MNDEAEYQWLEEIPDEQELLQQQQTGLAAGPFPFFLCRFDRDGNAIDRDPEKCLAESRLFRQLTPQSGRTILSKFGRKSGFGRFRVFYDRESAIHAVLAQPQSEQTDCVMLLPDLPVLCYGDSDFPKLETDTDEYIQQLHRELKVIMEQVFHELYPDSGGLMSDLWWWYECVKPDAWSFHFHANPYVETSKLRVFANTAELRLFVEHVEQRIEGNMRYHRWKKSKTEGDEPTLVSIIDPAVYNSKMNVKLGLCHKAGKPPMLLRHAPGWTKDHAPPLTLQVEVTLISLPPQMIGKVPYLPFITNEEDRLEQAQQQPWAPSIGPMGKGKGKRRTAAATGTTRGGEEGVRETDSRVVHLARSKDGSSNGLHRAFREIWGSSAQEYEMHTRVDRPDEIEGSMVGGTCVCPYSGRAHKSNRACFRIYGVQLYVGCYDDFCKEKAKKQPIVWLLDPEDVAPLLGHRISLLSIEPELPPSHARGSSEASSTASTESSTSVSSGSDLADRAGKLTLRSDNGVIEQPSFLQPGRRTQQPEIHALTQAYMDLPPDDRPKYLSMTTALSLYTLVVDLVRERVGVEYGLVVVPFPFESPHPRRVVVNAQTMQTCRDQFETTLCVVYHERNQCAICYGLLPFEADLERHTKYPQCVWLEASQCQHVPGLY